MATFDWMQLANSGFQDRTTLGNMWSGSSSAVGSWMNQLLLKNLMPFEYSLQTRRHLTGAEREQNAFNAEQAQIQRNFTQDIFNQQVQLENTATQRQVQDMQKAGLNPALMYQSGPAGSGTPSAGSGSSASGSPSGAPNLSAMIQLGLVGAQIQNLQAQAAQSRANANLLNSKTEGQKIDNSNKPEYWDKQLALMGANKAEADANIQNLLQQVKTGAADEALKRANERLTDVKITQADLENAILAYKVGMTATDAKYYDAMKSLDLAIKSATLDKTDEEIKNLRKARALMQAQIITEGAKSKMFNEQATATYEFGRYTHKKTTWIDADEIARLGNVNANTGLVQYLARKYDAEANYTEMKPLLELVETLSDFTSDVASAK